MSAGQGIGAVVGGIVGFMVAGPAGAFAGASLGMAAGGLLDPAKGPNVKGPRLDDLSIQVSTYGTDIPRIYGTIGGAGNVIQLENNKLKEKVRKKKSGGKGGGGSSETTTYSYSATFQLALCEGPIAGVRRIWCSDKLIYNAGSDDLETIIASNKAAKKWKLYLGTDDQLPDPRYEAEYGVGNVSAHRGLAYIAFYDFKLADYSNTLQAAQFKVEIIAGDYAIDPQKLTEQEMQGFSGDLVMRPYQGGVSQLAFYAYDPSGGFTVDGDGDYHPNVEKIIHVNYSGRVVSTSAIEPGDEILRPQVMSTGSTTVALGNFGGEPLWVPEYFGSYAINSGRELLPRGVLSNKNTTLVSGSLGDLLSSIGEVGRYLQGLAISQDEDKCLVMTGPNPMTISQAADKYFVFNTSGIVVDSGIVNGDSIGTLVVGNTPALSRGSIYFDGSSGWSYYSQSANRVSYFNISDGILTCTNVINEIASGTNLGTAAMVDNVFFVSHKNTGDEWIWSTYYAMPISGQDGVLLSSIISSECSLSGLVSISDIDVSSLVDTVRGYRVSGGSIRSSLEPLQSAFPFDVRAHGYKIQFLPRGLASVATIPWEDLGATSGDTPDDIFQQSREMDTQLPAKTVVKYLDASREYAIGEQFSERLNTEAVNKVERDLAIVLTANEAAGIAEMLNFLPWLERTPASFTLPPPYRYLEAGDVVTVVSQSATYEIRLNEANETQDGRLECQAVPNRAALYTPAATGAEGVPPAGTIGLPGESLLVLLDIPVIDETLQDAPGFVGVMTGYTNGWPGALAVRSIDDGQTWADLQAYTGKATIGTTEDVLPASDCTLIDQRSLLVEVISGEFESVTRDQMLAGINYAAYGVDGRWEIVRFQNAPLQAGGQHLISGFVRGEKGTEWATGLHEAGDYFILLDDSDNAFIGMAVGSIAVPAAYRGVTSGASVDDATDVPFTYQGVNLECLSPVYASGVRDGSSNFTGTFTRRSRLSSSWWATGVAAPIGEASEAYEIDVMNGSTVVRTLTSATPSFTYSAANQTTDFGSPQSSITFRIFQISATVGRGYPLEVTL